MDGEHGNSRRDFLRRSALAGAGVLFAGRSDLLAATGGAAPGSAAARVPSRGYAARDASGHLSPWTFERRALADDEILVDIRFSGVCHSDIHQLRGDWGPQQYPQVPGHEIAGIVEAVGDGVSRFRVGDRIGVGTMVGHRGDGADCVHGQEQYCPQVLFTYGTPYDGSPTGITQGGYANNIIVKEGYAIRIPETIPLESAASLLCAGITTYTPLLEHAVGAGTRLGVAGIGGLGHLAVKLAVARGAEVYAFTTSPDKVDDILGFGAREAIVVESPESLRPWYGSMDHVIDAIALGHDLGMYVPLVKAGGTYTQVGIPGEEFSFNPMLFVFSRARYEASLTGGIPQTQQLVDYCAANQILPETEVISADRVNTAWEQVVDKEARYRYVIDASTI